MKGKKESTVRIEPLIIFVGESDHGDMSYGSLVEQIAKTAENSGLVYQIFSEFPSQARKEETQQPLRSQQGEERFARIKEVISPQNENFVEIGSLDGRSESFYQIMGEVGDLKAKELKEHLLSRFSDKSRFPFLSELYSDGDIFRNFDEAKEAFLQELDQDPEDLVRDHGHWVGALNSKVINERMAEDLRQKRNPQADVVIVVAGSPHIPELGYLLEEDFSEESSKFVVSNKDADPRHAGFKSLYFEATEASLSKAGTLIGFEVESDGEAKLPSQIGQAIADKSFQKQQTLTFFEAEKLYRSSVPTELESGDYVGKFDELGKPTEGIISLKDTACDLFPHSGSGEKFFVGKFGEDGLPFEGEFRSVVCSIKLKTLSDGSRHLARRNLEGGIFVEYDYRDGQLGNVKVVKTNGDLLNGANELVTQFNEQEISSKQIALPSVAEIDQKFAPVRRAFEELRDSRQDHYHEYHQSLEDLEIKEKLQRVKDALSAKELLCGDTMFSELVGIKTTEDQQDKAIIEGAVMVRRGDRKSDILEAQKLNFGNCRECGAQTQRIAIDQGLAQTFILFGNPDHVFNVAIEGDKMIAIDGWNGDLIYDFSPKEFYQNQSLHAIFNLRIHKDSWFDAEKNPQGLLQREDHSVMTAKDALEARIREINEARFNPEIQEIICGRVEERLSTLDPNDAHYHSDALELKSIIDHFGLSQDLTKQMRRDYFEKFDPTILIVGNEAYVMYDLFCRDTSNPREEFENLKTEFLSKFSPTLNLESDRTKALVAGFDKVQTMEFGEEKSLKTIDKAPFGLEALDLATKHKPSPNPERSYAEKMSQVKGSKFNEI